MVLIDAFMQWSHVCLLSTRNHTFAKFMIQVIRLKANFSEHRLQYIRLDNAAESLHEISMIIVWFKKLKCTIRCHMCTLKMV
jgi:hypothetical protein